MASNADQIVQHVQHDFQAVVASVTGPEARSQTASSVELTLFRRRLTLGAAVWRRFFVTRAAVCPSELVTAPDGTPLRYHDQRPTTSDSVVGNVGCWRHDFTARGQEGRGPLDVELSWPARGSADRWREWAA